MSLRRGLALVALAALVIGLGFFAARWVYHMHVLDRASRDLEFRIAASLAASDEPVFLFSLFGNQVESVCFVTPYASAEGVLPPGTDLGMDAMWLSSVAENSIGVVALDRSGKVLEVARLSRRRIDLLPYEGARCHRRDQKPTLSRASEDGTGALSITIQRSGATPPG